MAKKITVVGLILLFNCICAFLFVPFAHSYDFTFRVPVEVTNMPPAVTAVKLRCTVWSKDGKYLENRTVPLQLGANRSYAGPNPVVVQWFVTEYANAANAARYDCRLDFEAGNVAIYPGEARFPLDTSKPHVESVGQNLPQTYADEVKHRNESVMNRWTA